MENEIFRTKEVFDVKCSVIHYIHFIKSEIEKFTDITNFHCKLEEDINGKRFDKTFILKFTLQYDTETGSLSIQHIFKKRWDRNWSLERTHLNSYPANKNSKIKRDDLTIVIEDQSYSTDYNLHFINEKIIDFLKSEVFV